MRIHVGCELSFEFPQVTPMIVTLNVHFSRFSDLERPDYLMTTPSVPVEGYRDSFGNWCSRLVAPAGRFSIGTDAVVRDGGASDPVVSGRAAAPSPAPASGYPAVPAWQPLLRDGSAFGRGVAPVRTYAARLAAGASDLRLRAQPHELRLRTLSRHQNGLGSLHGATRRLPRLRTSGSTFCRCLNIPARYCTGYITDIGLPPPYATMDFAAWMEVYLGGRWHTFDPRNNAPRIGRILIAHGRDAADVPLTHIFGPGTLPGFRVWAEEADPNSTLAA